MGPLTNLFCLAALVTPWRATYTETLTDANAEGFRDPRWCIALNAIALAAGILGNAFLLANFARRIRYIIAIPISILLWLLAAFSLLGSIVSMEIHSPPIRPEQTYSQGYWYAVIAAVLYFLISMLLTVNICGCWLGHYPQPTTLTARDQETLILQSMLLCLWIAIWAVGFSHAANLSYPDAVYFCVVTVLTLGFSEPLSSYGARYMVIPFVIGGLTFLGLIIYHIRKFFSDLAVEKKNIQSRKVPKRTIERTMTSEADLRQRLRLPPRNEPADHEQHGNSDIHGQTVTRHDSAPQRMAQIRIVPPEPRSRRSKLRSKLVLLREEKDRFDAMRSIQENTSSFKKWYSSMASILTFIIYWVLGATILWRIELREQNLGFAEALYFCFVSLFTIGSSEYTPRTNGGKPFFVVWMLCDIPVMTILISDLATTIIPTFKNAILILADWTVLSKVGIYRSFLERRPRLKALVPGGQTLHRRGRDIAYPVPEQRSEVDNMTPTMNLLAAINEADEELGQRLVSAIRRIAHDVQASPAKKYNYEEWVEITRLVRFTRQNDGGEEDDEGLVEWDWIGEDSPMLSQQSEGEWILNQLCESLIRYNKREIKLQNERAVAVRNAVNSIVGLQRVREPNARVAEEESR